MAVIEFEYELTMKYEIMLYARRALTKIQLDGVN